jgi:hypothetical protein
VKKGDFHRLGGAKIKRQGFKRPFFNENLVLNI